MFKIKVMNEKYQDLLEYKSEIIPQIGDVYAPATFVDNYDTMIVYRRLIYTHEDCRSIGVFVKPSN